MAILATERVLTLDWWKPASKLEVGDYVFDKDGKIVQIKLIQEYPSDDCYEVTFSDYLTVSGDSKLGFPTEDVGYRKRLDVYKGVFKFTRPLRRHNVEFFLAHSLRDRRNRRAYSVPTSKPLQLPHQTLPVPPYVFGFWFFNRRRNGNLCPPTGRLEEVELKLKDHGYKTKFCRIRTKNRVEFSISPTVPSQLIPNIPTRLPQNYLMADVDQRIELLAGIMASRGIHYIEKSNTFRFSSKNFDTVARVQMLAESLGCKTRMSKCPKFQYFSLFFKTKHQLLGNQKPTPLKIHHARRYIDKITPIEPQLCVHIETTAPDNTILVGEGFIPCR